jgi:multisubunit Na+/H+ antiporter MnhE subunit
VKLKMMPAFFLFLLLGAYWALLSGQFHNSFLIAAGVLCITFVLWMSRRMGLLDDEGVPVRFYPRAILYLPWLAWQVILSNWDVFKRTWAPTLAIDPRMATGPVQHAAPLRHHHLRQLDHPDAGDRDGLGRRQVDADPLPDQGRRGQPARG